VVIPGPTDPDSTSGGSVGGASRGPAPGQPPSDTATTNPFGIVLPEPAVFVQSVIDGVRERVAATVRPAAVVAVAEAFSFPLILMVAVLVFLLAQGRMDDPKFRKADTTIEFEDGDPQR
jgi:hypothetical protein